MTQTAGRLLNQADCVEEVATQLDAWWERVEAVMDAPCSQADWQMTQETFAVIFRHAPLLRRLLAEFGCHEFIRPKITSMLDVVTAIDQGEDMGGYIGRAREYAAPHLHGGVHSVPEELRKWAKRLRAEAANVATGGGLLEDENKWRPWESGETTALFISRLLACETPPELTARELALLEAHLKQRVSFSQVQRERQEMGRSPTWENREKLKRIRDYNRGLLAAGQHAPQKNSDRTDTKEAGLQSPPWVRPPKKTGKTRRRAKRKTDRRSVLAQLEKTTPPLEPDNPDWVKNKLAAKLESLTTRTLATYRSEGIGNGRIGRDKDGRVWRRAGLPNSHPWYLKSTLISQKFTGKNRQ